MKQALPSDVIRGASDAGVPELIQDLEPQAVGLSCVGMNIEDERDQAQTSD
jgi:hypothetical protein